MKVGNILDIIIKLVPILKYYRDRSLSEMLDDIYGKCCVNDQVSDSLFPTPGRVRKADKEKPRLQDAGTLMKKMNREERIDFLNVYTVVELKRIAADLNIKIKSRMNKPEVIKKIADLAGTPAYTTTAAHIAAESGGGGKQAGQATGRLGAAAAGSRHGAGANRRFLKRI